MKNLRKLTTLLAGILLSGCQSRNTPPLPEIVPAVEVKKSPQHMLGTIGAVEPVYMLPMKAPIAARIDTGATTSSIDADNITPFERDGEKWVSFDIINRTNGEKYHFEKKVVGMADIKRLHVHEKRYIVRMDVKLGKEVLTNIKFNLANRDKFEYQALIGRNILTGRAVVDTALSNTLN